MSKRILSLVLTLTLVLGSFSMAFADHADTTLTREQKIEYLKKEGFIVGNESGDDMLDAEIDRASVARILARTVLGGTGQTPAEIEKEIAKSNYVGIFRDVPQSHWANAPINIVTEKQITVGTGQGEFSPSRNITYVEVIAMMNRILELNVNEGKDWNMNKVYNIAAARDAGILEGIEFDGFNYDDVAERGVIFELLYNTVARHEVGNYQIDKVLVLENDRVISMNSNEIVVEVIKEVQRSGFVNSDERRGEQYKITLPEDQFDAEDLLGKVINLSYDKSKRAVAVELDESYDYVSGPMELQKKNLVVDGKTFTVSKDERYENENKNNFKYNDERIFNTYVNNEAFTYTDADAKYNEVDFGKATIKNGKVIFIDAFAFDDIAPVKEVNKDKSEVIVYNDENDGGTKRIKLDKDDKVVSFNDGEFHKMSKDDIKQFNVIHVAENSSDDKVVVVRQDSKVDGKYEKVVERKDETVIVVDEVEYEILATPYKKPVYSYNSKDFKELVRIDAPKVLEGFKNKNVTILQDVNGNLQSIEAEVDFGEFVGIVDRVVGKEVKVLKSNGQKVNYSATIDSDIKAIGDNGDTAHANLNEFEKGDVVYISANESEIDVMTELEGNRYVNKVNVDSKARFVEVDGVQYRAFGRTNVFVENDGKYVATTLEEVQKELDGVSATARIITDKDYNSEANPTYEFSNNDRILNTIVFEGLELGLDTKEEIVKLIEITNRNERIRVEYADGTKEYYTIDVNSPAYNDLKDLKVSKNDMVTIGINKDNDKEVLEISKLNTSTGFAVKGKVEKLVNNQSITLGGVEYYISDETKDFTRTLEEGDFVTLFLEDANSRFIKAIVDADVAGVENVDGSEEGSEGGLVSYVNSTDKVIIVDGETYEFNNTTILYNTSGDIVAVGSVILDAPAALAKDDVVTNIVLNKDGTVKSLVGTKLATQTAAIKAVKTDVNSITVIDTSILEAVAGLEFITANVEEYKTAIRAKDAKDINTLAKLQSVINAVDKKVVEDNAAALQAAINSVKEDVDNLDVPMLEAALVENANSANIAAYKVAIKAASKSELDTTEKLQALVEKVNAEEAIKTFESNLVSSFTNGEVNAGAVNVGKISLENDVVTFTVNRSIGNHDISTVQGTNVLQKLINADVKKINGVTIDSNTTRQDILSILGVTETTNVEDLKNISLNVELANNVNSVYKLVVNK